MPLPSFSRMAAGHPRITASALAGFLFYFLMPGVWHGSLRAALAWDAGSLLFLLLSLIAFSGERLSQMAQDAETQQEGEWTVFGVTLVGVGLSFGVIFQEFSQLKDPHAALAQYRVALVAGTLLLSWLVTHVCFAFRYAHEYYEYSDGKLQGGLEFPGGEPPDYWDFLYFSLIIGMTFQVSDVQISARKLRRLAILHSLMGFLFNTVLLAFAVNLAASLL